MLVRSHHGIEQWKGGELYGVSRAVLTAPALALDEIRIAGRRGSSTGRSPPGVFTCQRTRASSVADYFMSSILPVNTVFPACMR